MLQLYLISVRGRIGMVVRVSRKLCTPLNLKIAPFVAFVTLPENLVLRFAI